jgi:hypothetical protein
MKDETGWSNEMYYRTISFADINNDGRSDVCARASQGLVCWKSMGTAFDSNLIADPSWSNTAGFSDPKHYSTLRLVGAIRPTPDPNPDPVVNPEEPEPTPEPVNNPTPDPNEDVDWGDLNEGDPSDPIDPTMGESSQAMTSSGCTTSHAGFSGPILLLLIGFLLRRKRP